MGGCGLRRGPSSRARGGKRLKGIKIGFVKNGGG